MYTNAQNDFKAQGSFAGHVAGWLRLKACELCFDPFPNAHLRTNAFMVRRELFLKVWPRGVLTKRGAYTFENGRSNFTKRVRRLGLSALVVGRDGNAFEVTHWAESNTFRSSQQENLLIADNQTRNYQEATSQTQEWLAKRAWGRIPVSSCS